MAGVDKSYIVEPENAQTRVVAAASPRSMTAIARQLMAEVFGYGVVSGIAFAVDVTILKTLVDVVHWHYLLASTLSFLAGAEVAYALSKRYVFRARGSINPPLEFYLFAAVGVAGLLVTALVLVISISVLGTGLLTGKAIAATVTFVTNFILRRTLLFAS